ncbi:hypothetical protein ABPG74_013101 [Tetrahymena malaccensis]
MEQEHKNTEQQQQGQGQQEASTENNVINQLQLSFSLVFGNFYSTNNWQQDMFFLIICQLPDQKNFKQLQQQVEFQDQQEINQNEEQVINTINKDCGLMPEFKAADYKSLESIRETFAPSKNINDPNFTIPNQEHAIFFKLATSNKDNLHRAIKYGIWSTVPYQIAQIEKIYQKNLNNPLSQIYFYFFFENKLYGMAKLKEHFNPKKSFQLWAEEAKWFGIFEIEWIFVGKIEVVNDNQQSNFPYSEEQGLKLFELVKKSDFQTVFSDFDSFDQKEKELRKVREDRESEYYTHFCQKHSQLQYQNENGFVQERRKQYSQNKGYKHQNNQGFYQHNQVHQNYNHHYHHQNQFYQHLYNNGQFMNGNVNSNNAIQNMTNASIQQQQQQFFESFPQIQNQEQFELFLKSQPRIHFNQYLVKKNMNKKFSNNYQQKGYKNKYPNQQKPYNNNSQQLPTDPTSSQSPTDEHQEASSPNVEQTQQVEQNTNTQQHHHYHKNYQNYNNNRYNGYNNQYYNNNNQQVNGNYNGKFQHHKNYNHNGNYQMYNQNGNNNYYNNKKYNNNNNNNRNFKQQNQNRQNRQNHNQFQGYQGDQNDFPQLQSQNMNDVQQQNQVDDITLVEQQLEATNISQQ